MAWGKLDDQLYKDKTLLRVSVHARWLHVAAVSFCLEAGSGGRLEAAEVRFLAGSQGCRNAHIGELEREQEWLREGDGYVIRDFHKRYAITSNAARQARWRNAHRNDAGDAPETDTVTPPVTPERYETSPPSPTPPTPIPDSRIQGPAPPTPPSGVRDKFAEEYREWLAELNQQTGRHFRGDRKSETRFRTLRREGMTHDDLWALAAGAALSPFHRGENTSGVPYQDPITLLGSKQIGTLIELGRGELKARQVNGAGEDDWKMHSWALHPELAPGAEAQ